MSEVVGEGVIRFRADTSGVDTGAAGKAAGGGYSKGFLSSAKGILTGLVGIYAAAKVKDFFVDSVAEARESQKVAAVSSQIIKQTGGVANVTAGELGKLTTAVSNQAGVDDELIQKGANLLLTFKNVRNEAGKGADIFDRATSASADLAAAGFGSVESGAKGLGKALNDPLKGITALGRAGVTFSEGQKEQIKGFVEQGDLLSAQKIILGEVESQVGGVAAASATAGEKATVAFGNLKESVGTALLPVLDTLLNFFVAQIVPALYDTVAAAQSLGPVIGQVAGYIKGLFESDAAGGVFDTIKDAATQILPLLAAGFAAILPTLLSFFSAVQGAVQEVLPIMADTFTNVILPAVTQLADYLITNLLPVFQDIGEFVITQLVPTFVAIATLIYGTLYPAIVQIVAAVAENLKPVFDQLIATFRADLLPTLTQLVETIRTQLIPALQPIVEKMLVVIGFLLKLAATILGFVLPIVIKLAGFIISNLVPIIATIIVKVVQFIGFLIDLVAAIGKAYAKLVGFELAVVSFVKNGLDAVVSAIASIPGRIIDLGAKFLGAGKTIIGKFLEGLKGVGSFASGIADAVWDAVKGVINAAIDKLNSLLEFTINVGPKSFTVNAPNIGHLATGTDDWRGGLAVVGERGPELVNLPRGAQVIPNNRLAAVGGGPEIHVHMPTGDPMAAAMAMFNRLATAGNLP